MSSKIERLRAIVAAGQHAKVDGVTVDLFTASAIVAVYDALSAKNQAHYVTMPLHKMATMAFKLAAKS